MLGQQHTAAPLYIWIWSFHFDIVAFGVVKSIFCVAVRLLCNDLDDVDQWKSNDWIRMALEKRCVSDSVPIVLLFIENKVAEWHFLLIFTLALQKMTNWSYISQLSLQFATSLCHWIVNEGVLALDTTIFDGWHCEYDYLWYGILRVKILKRKMTISHEVEWSTSSLKMFRDHNNIVEKDASVRFERGDLFLLQTLDLFVWWTIRAKCNKSSFLGNQPSNDDARTCPELGKT